MAMDPETRALMKALVDGQLKLAESLASSHSELAKKVAMSDAKFRGEMAQLAKAQKRTEANLDRLGKRLDQVGKRMDGFRKDVFRGFTHAAARDHSLDKRVIALERR